MKKMMYVVLAIMLLAPAEGLAMKSDHSASPDHTGAMPAGHPVTAQPGEPEVISGAAAEVAQNAGYTYVNVEKNGKKQWIAVPAMKVVVGEQVSFLRGDEVSVIESKGLNRRFEKVILSSGPSTVTVMPSHAQQASQPPPAKPRQGVAVSGKVVEVLNSGGYTYVNVDQDGKTTWVAVPAMKVAVGARASFAPGDEMPGFSSKTLNRTFDNIIFSAGLIPAPKTARKAEAGGKIEKAAGSDAYTIAELYKNKAKLHKKTVSVRGKVVKVAAGIMNRNWIHLNDGSGSKKKGNDNLVVTTDTLPEEGDVVTMTGTFAKDKDFGSGYKYAIIVEKGSIVHE